MKDEKLWLGFLMNLLGVILGILLTFGGNALWQQREEKRKTKEMLILVRNELETNKKWFTGQEKAMREDSYVYKQVLEIKNGWESIHKDTLARYIHRTAYLQFEQLTFSAWQIFQNSEMIQKMTDKELVIRLTDCYFWINKIEEHITKEYWDRKVKAVAFELDPFKYFDDVLSNRESAAFYSAMSSDTFIFEPVFSIVDAIIDYTIMLLDKRGDFRYDMEEKDKEINSFIEARMDSMRQKNDTVKK